MAVRLQPGRLRPLRPFVLLAVLALLGGCAPSFATLKPAEVARKDSVGAHIGLGSEVSVNIPGEFFDLVDPMSDLQDTVDQGGTLQESQITDLAKGLFVFVMNPPLGISPRIEAGFAVLEDPAVEIELRLTPTTLRGGGRFQYLTEEDHGIAGSVGLGLGGWIAASVGDDTADFSHSRFELDLPLLFGWSGRIGHFWFGPKLLYTNYSYDLKINVGGETLRPVTIGGDSLYIGGVIGGGLGYRYVWLVVELSVMSLSGSATVDVAGQEQFSLSTTGVSIAPAIGLISRF